MVRTDHRQHQEHRPARLWPAVLVVAGFLALFDMWEVVAGDWMSDTFSAEALLVLHIVSGVGSLVLVGAVVGWFLLRHRMPDAAVAAETPVEPSAAIPDDEWLRRQAGWLIGLRWIACLVGIAALFVLAGLPEATGYRPAMGPLLVCLLLVAVCNAVFSLALRAGLALGHRIAVHMAADLILLTAILHFAGSIDTAFAGIYVLHLIIANILLPRRAAVGITVLATGLVIALLVAEGTGLIPHQELILGRAHAPVEWLLWGLGVLVALAGAAYLSSAAAGLLRERRRQLNEALRAVSGEREKLEHVLDAAGAGLLLLDDERRVLWASTGVAGMSRKLEVHSDDMCRHCPRCAAKQAMQENRVVSTEFAAEGADGQRHYFRTTASPLGEEHRSLGRVVEVVQDITAAKAMEEEIVRSGKLAAAGRLAAVVAHEVGNPLASLRARVSLLERTNDPAFARESASVLRKQLDRVERIIRGLSRFARPSHSHPVECDVGDIVREVVDFVKVDPRAREVLLEVDVPGDVPSVHCVRDELVQVFLNLAINGIQAAGPGGRVRFEAIAKGESVRICVTDSGPGISDTAAERVFEPFFTTRESGVGLGLAISRSIVRSHGGSLSYESNCGPGACFAVNLPAYSRAEVKAS